MNAATKQESSTHLHPLQTWAKESVTARAVFTHLSHSERDRKEPTNLSRLRRALGREVGGIDMHDFNRTFELIAKAGLGKILVRSSKRSGLRPRLFQFQMSRKQLGEAVLAETPLRPAEAPKAPAKTLPFRKRTAPKPVEAPKPPKPAATQPKEPTGGKEVKAFYVSLDVKGHQVRIEVPGNISRAEAVGFHTLIEELAS